MKIFEIIKKLTHTHITLYTFTQNALNIQMTMQLERRFIQIRWTYIKIVFNQQQHKPIWQIDVCYTYMVCKSFIVVNERENGPFFWVISILVCLPSRKWLFPTVNEQRYLICMWHMWEERPVISRALGKKTNK